MQKKRKKEFWNNFPNRRVATSIARRWSWEVWRVTIMLRIQACEIGPLASGLLIPSRQIETMPSCCLLVTSVWPAFKWRQMLPWSSGAVLIACRGQVGCFTCLGWGMREVRSIFLLAAEAWLKRVYWCSLWSHGSTCIVRGSGSCRPLQRGVEPTFLVGISPVWGSHSDLQILQGPGTLAVPVVSLCGTL